jgi:hypothetical protein
MVDHLDPRYRPIVYDVAMSPEQIGQWPAEADLSGGNRTRAAQAAATAAGHRPRSQGPDNLSPQPQNESAPISRGDNCHPLVITARGDDTPVQG